jgi:hypothetical protein
VKIRTLFLAVLVLGSTATCGLASPITFDFSGTLAQPINGSTAISGTFSYEQAITGLTTGKLVGGWAGALATLKVGGLSYEFTNYNFSSRPSSSFEFDANSKGQGDNFTFQGPFGSSTSGSYPNPSAAMTIHLGDPSATAFPASNPNLPTLNLASFSIRDFSVTITPSQSSIPSESGGGTPIKGTITSLSPEFQAAPEPTTLALFTMIGLGLAVRWKVRRMV